MRKQLYSAELKTLLTKAEQEGRPPEVRQRLHWFLDYADHHSVSKVCQKFGIARSTFYRWVQRFEASDLSSLEDNPTIPTGETGHDPADPIDHSALYVNNQPYKGPVHATPTVMRTVLVSVMVAVFLNSALIGSLVLQNSSGQTGAPVAASVMQQIPPVALETGSTVHVDLSTLNLSLSDCSQDIHGEWSCHISLSDE